MWLVGLFKASNLVGAEHDINGGEGVVEVRGFGGAYDWRGHAGLLQHPGQGDLRAR